MSDALETQVAPRELRRQWTNLEARRIKLGVADELKDVPGVTTLMLVLFGEQGIKSIEDLAACATDDLCGWSEDKSGSSTKHEGILERFKVSRSKCDAMILHARIRAGWIDKASATL
jgi:transcription termination/antitermination protein NusA